MSLLDLDWEAVEVRHRNTMTWLHRQYGNLVDIESNPERDRT